MTMTVGARSLDNEERSNFRDYMSLLSLSVDASMMIHLILVIAVVIILAASYLLTFALCRAATRRDMLEARWREESAGSVSEESHESA